MPHGYPRYKKYLEANTWGTSNLTITNNIYIESSKATSIWLTDSVVKFSGALQQVSSGTAALIPMRTLSIDNGQQQSNRLIVDDKLQLLVGLLVERR
jgi:hypothetical protein